MCGIAGIAKPADVGGEQLLAVMEAMAHRGPDDHHVVWHEGLGLGARRLAIVDTSSLGRQPAFGCDNTIVVALNGEIYNDQALRRELVFRGHTFRGHSDTEVVAHAWEEWGAGCVTKLEGMFALGVFDTTRLEISLIRDRLGEKPLYYFAGDGNFAFASEVRALRAGGFGAGINLSAVAAFARYGSLRGAETMTPGMYAVAPGSILSYQIATRKYAFTKYWNATVSQLTSRDQTPQSIRRILTAGILSASRADVPGSLYLSAGLDSAVLASVLSRTRTVTAAHTLRFDVPGYDESAGATDTAQFNGLDLNIVEVQESDWPSLIQGFVSSLDQPSVDGFNNYILCKAVGREFKLAFTGLGADELFGGYSTFRYLAIPRLLPLRRSAIESSVVLRRAARGRLSRAALIASGGTGPLRESYDFVRQLDPLLRHSLKRAATPSSAWPLDDEPDSSLMKRVVGLELSRYLVDTLLRDTDSVSMHSSVELRSPFLHPSIIELALSLANNRPGESARKSLLREAFKDELPVRLRAPSRKTGFAVPVGKWLTSHAGRDFVHDEVTQELWDSIGIFTPKSRQRFLRLLEVDMSSPNDYSRYLTIFGALILTLWCRDNHAAAA